MANKYDLELAVDSYRAKNGKEQEIGLFEDGSSFQYGSQKFFSREQAVWWLKQQNPDHEAIKKMIAEERKNYPNSGLNSLIDTYEKYYGLSQGVRDETRANIDTIKPALKESFIKAFLETKSSPFTFKYGEGGEDRIITVNIIQNTMVIGGRIHKLTSDTLNIGDIKIDGSSIYLAATLKGSKQLHNVKMSKSEFVTRYLDNLLTGKDIKLGEHIVHIQASGDFLGVYSTTPTSIQETSAVAPEMIHSLNVYGEYAKIELAKSGKTIKELQQALQEKKHYTGALTGTFDQATLDAVKAFQMTIKNPKYGVDGLVGSEETIPALFGVQAQANTRRSPSNGSIADSSVTSTIPGPTRRLDDKLEPNRYPQDPTTAAPKIPTTPAEKPETLSEVMKSLDISMTNFRKVTQAVSQKEGTFFDTPEEIKKFQTSINDALEPVIGALAKVEAHKLVPSEKAKYDSIVMEISRYFSDKTAGVNNRHYKNYDLSFDLAVSLIQDDLKKQNITVPKRPGKDEVLKAVKERDAKLHERLVKDLRAGYDLGQILSNPQVRSQWDGVYETVYDKYEDDMQTLLTTLKKNRPTLASAQGNEALDMMISVMGTKDWLDFKARNRDVGFQTLGMVGATGAGIVAGLATPFTGGASGILSTALIGGAVTTAGMIWTKGRGGLDRETFTELGINTAMFGLGGALARGTKMLAESGRAFAGASAIALDASGGVALGMTADYVRALEANVGYQFSTSFRNNLPWALLPIALGNAKWITASMRTRSENVSKGISRAQAQNALGDRLGAQATLAQMESSAEKLAGEIKAAAPKGATNSIIGSRLPPRERVLQDIQPDTPFSVSQGGNTVGNVIRHADGTFEFQRPGQTAQKFRSAKEAGDHMQQQDIHFADKSLEVNPVNTASTHPNRPEILYPLGKSQITELNKHVDTKIASLKNPEDIVSVGKYSVKKDGNQYHLTDNNGQSYFLSKKDAINMLKGHIQEGAIAQQTLKSIFDEQLHAVPAGFNKTVIHEGKKYIVRKPKNGGEVEFLDANGKVLSHEEMNTIGRNGLQKDLDGYVSKFGNIPVKEWVNKFDPKYIDIQFQAWKDFNAHKLPVGVKQASDFFRWSGAKLTNFTVKSVLAPVRSVNALADAYQLSTGVGSGLNNFAKAFLLRDAGIGWKEGLWKSTFLRGTLATGATAATLYEFDDNSITSMILDRMSVTGWWSSLKGKMGSDGAVHVDRSELAKTSFALYWGGAFWGLLFDYLYTQSQPITWRVGNKKSTTTVPPSPPESAE